MFESMPTLSFRPGPQRRPRPPVRPTRPRGSRVARWDRPPREGGAERGLTLVELMIALGILALVMASLLAVFDSILQMSRASGNLMTATLDAQMVMEEISDIDYDDLRSYAPPTPQNLREEIVDVKITDETGGPILGPLPEIVRIAVEVSWKERGAPVKTTLTTLRSRGL